MTKHIVDSELLDQAVAAIEKGMCVQCDGISCCRPESLTALGRIQDVLRTKPAADSGMEVVAWQDAENPLYTTGEKRQMHGWATDGYPIVELVRKSDADARDAMRLERIAELEAQLNDPDYPPKYSRRLIAELRAKWRTEHDTANAHIMAHDALRTELASLKAQEPVAYLDLDKVSKGMAYASNFRYSPKQTPLYAAPVAKQEVMSDDKTVERVMADVCEENKEFEMGIPYYALCVHEFKEVVARLNGGKAK